MSFIQKISRPNMKLLEIIQTGYVVKGTTPEQQKMSFHKIICELNRKHDKTWQYNMTRMYEIPRPSRYQELYQRELKRRKDRRTIAFLCKYVMAEKQVKIPMK